MLFNAELKRGILKFNREAFLQHLQRLRDGRYWIEIKRVQAKRSNEKNKFWHGHWLPIIAQHFGYPDPEDACRAVKISLNYCRTVDDPITKSKRWDCQSTAKI